MKLRTTLALLITAAPVAATVTLAAQRGSSSSFDLAQDPPGAPAVGTPLRWTVTSRSGNEATYRFSVERPNGATLVFVDYRKPNVFSWTPSEEGRFVVRASVKDESGREATTSMRLDVTSRVSETSVVTLTAHPLVALFSSPPCPAGLHMRVLYKARDARTPDATPIQHCDGKTSMNFLVAGLGARWDYAFRAELLRNATVPFEHGPALTLQAGAVKATLPPRRTTVEPTPMSSSSEKLLLQSPANNTVLAGAPGAPPIAAVPWASDLAANVVWYYDGDPSRKPSLMQPVSGGSLLLNLAEDGVEGHYLQEIDLVGNVVRETNRRRLSEQLKALGHDEIGSFHHHAIRLPDGNTAVITSVERVLEDVQGPGAVDVLGDMIVVLDRDWQVTWVWNAFDHLDVRRPATLDEKCSRGKPGCPPFFLADAVNDWTHTNSITYSPDDGNLVFSVRNQDWVVKVDYRDGVGDGDVLWRLGPDGDFTLESDDPYPWLSHQHDPQFVDRDRLVLYDNGNTRCKLLPDHCYSRGQVYHLDESGRVAKLTLNFNLTSYSFALGSAQPLANGNFHFNSGIERNREGRFIANSDEIDAGGTSFVYAQMTETEVYRSWRLVDLYMSSNDPESLAYAVALFGSD